MAESNAKLIMKKAIPRVLKAAVWGSLTYLLLYYVPLVLFPLETLPFDYTPVLLNFAVIAVFFAIAGVLFSGTIIGYGFGVARAILIIAFFFIVSNSGIFSTTLLIMGITVNLTVDISVILFMIISVNLLDIVINLLHAITLLESKSSSIEFIGSEEKHGS